MTDDKFNKSLADAMSQPLAEKKVSIPMPVDSVVKLAPVQPEVVTVIGNQPSGTVIVTPDHQPNIVVNVVTPIIAIASRFITSFLTALLGILTGAMATQVITATDFLHLVYKCAGLALAGAVIGLIKDLITVFGKLEGKYPLATGSV